MFTRCPNCDGQQTLTADQLRLTRAICFCPDCRIHFDALEQLSDTGPDLSANVGEMSPDPAVSVIGAAQSEVMGLLRPSASSAESSPDERLVEPTPLPWEQPPANVNPQWRMGAWGGLLVLIGQLLYFHGNGFSQSHTLRRICQTLPCPLPVYRNAAEWAIVRSTMRPLPDHSQLFEAVITNQADFAQAYPGIALALQDYAGNVLARRRFRPDDYLLNANAVSIKPDATVVLRLNIAPTNEAVGGYTFDLVY